MSSSPTNEGDSSITDAESSLHLKSPSDASPSPRRHSDLWFSDGSIVLRARDVLFRVHMTQLSRRSAFFRDLFSLPQPTNDRVHCSQESIEGCIVIDLHDDPDDLANLLYAIYDGPAFGNNDLADFQVVSGVLRLATKYALDGLRDRALAHLGKAWPTTLEGWDAREDSARAHDFETGQSLYPSPIAVINLANEVNAPELLPAAFYALSRYTYAQLFDPSASALSFIPLTAALNAPQHPSTSLSVQDIQRLSLGKEAASLALSSLISSLARSPTGVPTRKPSSSSYTHTAVVLACTTPGACRRDFAELAALATQHYICERGRGCLDPLLVADELSALLSECRACARALEAWAARERARIWRCIPAWFRLEDVVQ